MDMFQQEGIRFAVVSEDQAFRFDAQRILRQILQRDQFQLLGRFPISSNEESWKGQSLLLYENKAWKPPTGKFLTLRMLTLRNDIVVPFSQFEFLGDPSVPAQSQEGK